MRSERDRRVRHPRVGVVEVAHKAGVSTATVSRVLNGVGVVRPETRSRVLSAVRDLDYAPNNMARALASQRSNTIGVIVPSLRGSIFAPSVEAIQRHAERQGIAVILACSEYDVARELEQARTFVARGVDGLVLVGLIHDPELKPFLARRGVPYVCQSAYSRRGPHACVGFDNAKAMVKVTRDLLHLGHKRFAVIAGISQDNDRVQDRIAGIRSTLEQHGLALADDCLVEARYDISEARQAARRVLAARRRPTAIVCINDVLALGTIFECQVQGIDVPGEISVFGFDDLEFAQHMHPSLSTVRVPTAQMGEGALDQVLARVRGQPGVVHSREIEVELIPRGSTAAPPRKQPRTTGAGRGA